MEYAEITPMRCRACMMTGGTVASSPAHAAALSQVSDGQVFQVGDRVALDPCLDMGQIMAIAEETGRDCPRVDLHPDNEDASALATILLQPGSRHLVSPVLNVLTEGMDRAQKKTFFFRALTASSAPEVVRAWEERQTREAQRQAAESASADSGVGGSFEAGLESLLDPGSGSE